MATYTLETSSIAAQIQAALQHLDRHDFATALWERRMDVWPDDPQVRRVVANRLGWLDAPDIALPQLTRLESFATQVRASGLTDVMLFGMGGSSLVGTVQEVEKLLTGLLPADQVADILAEVRGNANRSVWERMASVSESVLASYLVKEHPQTAALILSRVKPAIAAKVMGHLPLPLRNTVMRRMLSFKPVVDEAMQAVERALHEDFLINGSRNSGADTHAKMADIINKMDRQQMDEALTSLAEARPNPVHVVLARLEAAGLHFRRMVEEVRQDAARQCLRDTDMALVELAASLGFADHASFNRAFKRWTGMSPGAFRRSPPSLESGSGLV